MSQENVEIVRGFFDRWGTDEWRSRIADDVVWDSTGADFVGLAGIYEGHAGVEKFFRDWLAPWEQSSVELLEIIDAGDSVVTQMRWRGRGRGSGVEVQRDSFGIYRLRDGVVVAFCQRETREEALEAAGLLDDD